MTPEQSGGGVAHERVESWRALPVGTMTPEQSGGGVARDRSVHPRDGRACA